MFHDQMYISPQFVVFVFVWTFFIKANFMTISVKPLSTDIIKPTDIIKKFNYHTYLYWNDTQLILMLICFFSYRGYDTAYLWNQFGINNFNTNIIIIIATVLILLIVLFKALISNNISYNIDFFFSISNVVLFLTFIFFICNLFGFIFFLEINSLVVLYKFISSRYWYQTKKIFKKAIFDHTNRAIPQSYLNMLFFQYWSTFFSSLLLFYSISNIFLNYGTTEFIVIEYLNAVNVNIKYLNNMHYTFFVWSPLFFGFLLKIGLTPFHLFKIEVYKGLPLITLVFYTSFYFFVYFLYLVLFLCVLLPSVKYCLAHIFYFVLIVGTLYMTSLMFDITSLKAFFAYSTIINSVLFSSAILVL